LRPRSRAAFTAISRLSVPPVVMKPAPLGAGLQPVADDDDHVGLDRAQAGERIGVQRVLAGELRVRRFGDGDHVVAGVVGERERVAVAPADVALLEAVELARTSSRRRP
jgi:hypothetical protein